MRDLICKYHPKFVNNQQLKDYALESSEIFDVERLVEDCLAYVGNYNRVAENYRDFDDIRNSDSKTVSIVNNGNSYVFIIGNVENKIGSLRVTVYNYLKQRLDYFYLPQAAVYKFIENDGTKGTENKQKMRIRATYSVYKDSYNQMNPYRVMTFEKLAKCMD